VLDQRTEKKEKLMKKNINGDLNMLPDYDLSAGVRGKYSKQYAKGTNVIVLEADVVKIFPNATVVNRSLRKLVEILKLQKAKPLNAK